MTFEVEGYPARQVHLWSIQDHTIGIRNWFDFHRYCVHYIHVEEVRGSTSFKASGGYRLWKPYHDISRFWSLYQDMNHDIPQILIITDSLGC